MELSCPGMTLSRSEAEKIISGVGDNFCVFFIFLEDKLRTSWSFFLWVDFIVPPPAKPLAMTLMVLVIGSSSSSLFPFFLGSKVFWFLEFLLSSSLEGDAFLFLRLLSEAMYFVNLPSFISSEVVAILYPVLETIVILTKQGPISASPCLERAFNSGNLSTCPTSLHKLAREMLREVFSWYLPTFMHTSFIGRSSLDIFLVWFLLELVVALSISSRKMYFVALI